MNASQLFDTLANPAFLTPIGVMIGAILKKVPWFNTKGIPMLTFLIAGSMKSLDIATGGATAPTVVSLALPIGAVASMGFLDNWIVSGIVNTFLQTSLTTGIHGAWKNFRQWIANGPTMTVPVGDPRGK